MSIFCQRWANSGGLPTLGQRWPDGQTAVGPTSVANVGPTDVPTLGQRRSDGGMLSGKIAIADKVGNSSLNISKDENLTRQRNRPKGPEAFPPETCPYSFIN